MERKIFAPDLMFNNYERGKIPVNDELKEKGIYALEIKPQNKKEWFAFSFPVNKQWKNEEFYPFLDSYLIFDVVGCDSFKLDIILMDERKNEKRFKISVLETGNWNHIKQSLYNEEMENIQMVMFTGSSKSISYFLMKDIIISGDLKSVG
jgi:hypothetical protein